VLSGNRKWLAAGLVVGLVLVSAVGAYGFHRWQRLRDSQPAPLPKTAVLVPVATAPPAADSPTPTAAPTPPPTAPPGVRLLPVPYTGQAPSGNWNPAHEEFCEAATVLMTAYWYEHKYVGSDVQTIPPAEADSVMTNQIVPLERRTFPNQLDLALTDVAQIGAAYDQNVVGTVSPVDPEAIRQNLAAGRPVIIPVMTQLLNGQLLNGSYTYHRGAQGGFGVYHLMVLIGYDTANDSFWADDPGIVPQGKRVSYPWSLLSTAIDAQAQSPDTKVRQGRVMLVFSPRT
jgi:Peptidase_C39 like family